MSSRNIQVRDLDKPTSKNLDSFKDSHHIKTDAKAIIYMINRENSREKAIENLEKRNQMLQHKLSEASDTLELLASGFDALNKLKELQD